MATIAFSKDGSRVAFETRGVLENTGTRYEALTVIDVTRNRVVAGPVRRDRWGDKRDPRRRAAVLAKYRIVDGIAGTVVRQRTRSEAHLGGLRQVEFTRGTTAYRLVVRETHTSHRLCLGNNKARALTLTLTRTSATASGAKSRTTRTLVDEVVPITPHGQSRCSADYTIERVIRYQRALVVVIDFVVLGKGTRDQTLVAVAAEL